MFRHERTAVRFSKNIFICLVAVGLIVTSPICLSEDSYEQNSAVIKDLGKNLAKKSFVVLLAVDPTGNIQVLAPNGEEIPPCGNIEGTTVEGNCNLKGEIKNLSSASVGIIKGSPTCMWINVGNRLRKVHAGGDVDAQGRKYQRGWQPCDEQSATSPPHHF